MALALPWVPFFLLTGVIWFLLGQGFQPPPAVILTGGLICATVCGLAAGLYGLAQVHHKLRRVLSELG
jgi:hypothetical protein